MSKVIIYGLGRAASIAYRYLKADTEHEVVGFTVDPNFQNSNYLCGLPVTDFSKILEKYPPEDYCLFAPLGHTKMNSLRESIFNEGKKRGYTFISYISTKIHSHDTIQVGENCLILEGTSINFDVTIGNNVVIWSSVQIGDLTNIKDHAWITSHATICGGVTIGENAFLGAGCTVVDGIEIGAASYIGANTLITKNTAPQSVYISKASKESMLDSAQLSSILD
jgi:sugar O-acyltransferase (sialic acid O-acetyltransferase NeuD family)